MFDRAARLEKAFRRFPRAPLFARLADHHLSKGRLVRTQALCEEGCERFPLYPTGFFVLGRCYARQEMWEEARSALDRGLRLDPENPAGYRRLSRVYRQLGNTTLALKCLERAADLDPLSDSLGPELRELRELAAEVRVETSAPVSVVEATRVEDARVDTEQAAVEELDEGLFDDEPDPVAEQVESAQQPAPPVAEEADDLEEAEPFGAVNPLPEWDESAATVTTIEAVTEAGAVEPPVALPPEEVPESDEVAALGAGLFDDEADSLGDSSAEETPAVPAPRPVADDPPVLREAPVAAPVPDDPPVLREAPAATPAQKPVPDDLPVTEEAPAAAPTPAAAGPDPAAESVSRGDPAAVRIDVAVPAPEPQGVTTPAWEEAVAPQARKPGTTVARLSAPNDAELTALLQQFDSEPMHGEEEYHEGPLPTVTLAELYSSQGFPGQALEIYQRVLADDPGNEAARRGAAALNAA